MTRALIAIAVVARAGLAAADDAAVPDVKLHDAPPEARRIAISWHPIPLITGAGKLEFDLQIVPIDHHALVVNAFYSQTATAAIVLQNADGSPMVQLPEQKFTVLGLELGYRYYRGVRGPRGLFVGPSLVLARVHEAQGMFGDGSTTDYADIGVAVDAGYAALIDGVALTLGVGVQALETSKTIPPQQLPARIYADAGVVPRFVFSVGYAF